MKRQRGRGRKPGGGGHNNNFNPHQPNRTMESSGPDIKVRGPASHIYERYLQLARDASSSGDRVLSENYLQHADHYFRLVRQMQPAMPPPQAERFTSDVGYDGEEEDAPETEGGDGEAPREGADASEGEQVGTQAHQQPGDRAEGDFRRRRGRRNRFRPGGPDIDGAEVRDDREPRQPREERAEPRGEQPRQDQRPEQRHEARAERVERPERRDRAPRERVEPESAEGFSNGPKPAFLGGD